MSHLIPGVDSPAPGPDLAQPHLSLSHTGWCQAQALGVQLSVACLPSYVCAQGTRLGELGHGIGSYWCQLTSH